MIGDATWVSREARDPPGARVEIPLVVGQSTMPSMLATAAGVELEGGLERLPIPPLGSVTGQDDASWTWSTDQPAASVPCNVSRPTPPGYEKVQTGTPGSGPPQPWKVHPAAWPGWANSIATASGVAHCPAAVRFPASQALTTARAARVGVVQLAVGTVVSPVDGTLVVVVGRVPT